MPAPISAPRPRPAPPPVLRTSVTRSLPSERRSRSSVVPLRRRRIAIRTLVSSCVAVEATTHGSGTARHSPPETRQIARWICPISASAIPT